VFDELVSQQVQNDFRHSAGLAVARSLKDHVLHFGAAQMLDTLLAQNPGDGVGNIALAAAIWAHNAGYAVTSEDEVSMIRKGLKARDFEAS
jgi:hypothetical protein